MNSDVMAAAFVITATNEELLEAVSVNEVGAVLSIDVKETA